MDKATFFFVKRKYFLSQHMQLWWPSDYIICFYSLSISSTIPYLLRNFLLGIFQTNDQHPCTHHLVSTRSNFCHFFIFFFFYDPSINRSGKKNNFTTLFLEITKSGANYNVHIFTKICKSGEGNFVVIIIQLSSLQIFYVSINTKTKTFLKNMYCSYLRHPAKLLKQMS